MKKIIIMVVLVVLSCTLYARNNFYSTMSVL